MILSSTPGDYGTLVDDHFSGSIVENQARVVAGTKTLHHLLPDLAPPVDTRWTGAFFMWPPAYFQNRQRQVSEEGFRTFAEVARLCHPQQYVGAGWRTCRAKILDNANH